MANTMLYLASRSPRRQELLQQIGVNFKQVDVSVDESLQAAEPALDYAARVARLKAVAGWQYCRSANLACGAVLGADTCVVLEDQILGKPSSAEHGRQMLRQLSGRSHKVISAVALKTPDQVLQAVATTEVCFRELSDQEIADYWYTGEPQDKAGGYGIQGLAAVFVANLTGNYSTVVGLPLFETSLLLKQAQIPVWQAVESFNE